MSRRNQARRRRTYGRRQHEVRERRDPDTPAATDAWSSDEAWADWTHADRAQDQQASDDGPYGNYAR